MVDFKKMIPTPERLGLEVLIVLGGVLGAAFIISRFPNLQKLVQDNSVTVKDKTGNVLF